MTDTQYLDHDGGRLSYDDTGGDGPLVIAAPGMGDRRQVYRHLTPRLVDAGCRVVTFDLRGVGDSSVGWSELSGPAVARDYLALLDHLGGGPAVLIGNSLSCAAAVVAATDAPDQASGIVLLGPFVRDVPQKWWQRAMFAAVLRGPWGRRAWTWYYKTQLYPGPKPSDLDGYVAALSANLAEPGRFASFRTIAFTSHAESGRRLSDVGQPVLVVMGTADPDFPDAVAEARHLGSIFGSEPLLVDGSGHYPQADNPDAVAPAVIDFVRRATSGRAGAE